MKILFDENVPYPLRQFFREDEVSTVQEMGWAGIKNGDLIVRATPLFDVLILADKNLRYQQNLSVHRLAIVELPTNRWPQLKLMADEIVAATQAARPSDYIQFPVSGP